MSKRERNDLDKSDCRKTVERFKREPYAVFNQLIRDYQDMVYNLCRRFFTATHDAEDSAQETMVRIYRSFHRFQCRSTIKTWIYRVTVNTCKSRLDSLKRKWFYVFSALSDPDSDKPYEIPDSTYAPDKEAERREEVRLVEKAIAELPDEQRMMIVLRDLEGKSYDEIADLLGIKMGTVKSKISRARHCLSFKLKGVLT